MNNNFYWNLTWLLCFQVLLGRSFALESEEDTYIHPVYCKNNKNFNESHDENSIDHQNAINTAKNDVAKQIYDLIDHFKKDDPVGLPIPMEDPIQDEKIVTRKLFTTLTLDPVFVHGVSKFRMESVEIELDKVMNGSLTVSFDELIFTGSYTIRPVYNIPNPYKIIFKDLKIEGTIVLGVKSDGKLKVQEIEADMHASNMVISFENLSGIMNSTIDGLVNTKDDSFFNKIKPDILSKMKVKMAKNLNEKLDENLPEYKVLPNSIGPIDFAIAEGRKFVRERFDPLRIDDIENEGVFGYRFHDTEVYGVSTFYRAGDIHTSIENKSIVLDLTIGTQEINGKTIWEASIAKGMLIRSGRIRFSVAYIKVHFRISQPLDLSKRLKIEDFDVDIGNIQTLSSGLGTLDYLIEFLLNIFPNLLRYQIMEVVKSPITERIQQFTDRIDAEDLLKEKVNEFLTCGSVSMDLPFLNTEL